jgi:hypothetical protein
MINIISSQSYLTVSSGFLRWMRRSESGLIQLCGSLNSKQRPWQAVIWADLREHLRWNVKKEPCYRYW